mmetsp:Transcript_29106/g.60669  ORF Transcript_29106/g.60669 Transcript_29106/m.60669 type:complete len:460 (+) Transcript_29106:245-1624(+)
MKSIKATSRSIGTCASSIQRTIGTNGTLTVPHRRINQRLINNRQYQYRYKGTTTSAENNTISAEVKGEVQEHHASSMTTHPPSARQLMVHALRSAVPMIGFGFMDNTIMIHAGHYVDCTLGVTFGLSTLAAAGIGQIFSGIGGVVFGDALDNAFRRMLVGNNGSSSVGNSGGGGGVSSGTSNSTKMIMNSLQKNTRASRLAGLTGGIFGVTLGCALGLVNLLFVDEHRATLLKLRALEEGQEFEFEVEVDNERHSPEYTTVIVRGPDVDGVLASITAAIASMGCSVVELHAGVRNRKGIDLLEDQESGGGSGGGGASIGASIGSANIGGSASIGSAFTSIARSSAVLNANTTGEHYPIQTHATGSFKNYTDHVMAGGRMCECGPLMAVDPLFRCIALHLYDGYLTILPINRGYDVSKGRRTPWRRNATAAAAAAADDDDDVVVREAPHGKQHRPCMCYW